MGCGCACVSKVFLILLNILTGLFGFILLAVGLFAQFAGSFIEQYLKQLGDVIGSSGPGKIDLTGMYKDLLPIVNGIAIPLIVIGLFLLIVSMFGCYGACCNNRVCLLIYAIMVTIIFVGILAGVIYLLAGAAQIKQKTKESITKEIEEKFVGIASTNAISLMMNVIQIYFKCCGMENSKVYDNAKKWNRTVSYGSGVLSFKGKIVIPVTCCEMTGSFPSVAVKDKACPTMGVPSYKDVGCFDKLVDYASEYTTYLYVGLALPLVFLAILMALGWFLWKQAGDSDIGSVAKMV